MAIEVEIAHAETHFSELLSKVEVGEEVVILRGNTPIARLVRIEAHEDRSALINALKTERARRKPVSQEEIRQWRDEGRR